MTTSLLLLPYLQSWDGAALAVRLLLIPRGSPLDALIAGAPSFPEARFDLEVHVVAGLDSMPTLGGPPTTVVNQAVVPTAKAVFDALAVQLSIDPSPPPPTPRRPGVQIKKHLPTSYQVAAQYVAGRTPFVYTDDSYDCARSAPPPTPYQKIKPQTTMPWGKVIASLLRQPVLAGGAGLIRSFTVAVTPSTLLAGGGWLYVTLAPTSDAAGLLGVPDGLKVYAARIPLVSAPCPLFTPDLFPVTASPPSGSYDDVFAEVDNYDDGFAKTVHCAQPQQLDPLNETPDGTRPVREMGVRLGWDDEQVTTWLNRQIDPAAAALDTPMGVLGYRVDGRAKGQIAWHSLCHARGPVSVQGVRLGTFDGDLGVEAHPVQLHGQTVGDYWLPTYLTNWIGSSMVTVDTTAILLAGGPDKTDVDRVQGADPDLALRYGTDYEFRVRLVDHTGGGPDLAGAPSIPGPSPVGSIAFRRWIRPLRVRLVDPPPPDPDPSAPPASLTVTRPLLGYPAVALTGGYIDPVVRLVADLPAAKNEGREVALADPDVTALRIVVQARGLTQDPQAADGGFVTLYETTRPFSDHPDDTLVVDLDWVDVHDATTLAPAPSGPLAVPTARDVRLRLSALGRDDPMLGYFGADDVRFGPAVTVDARARAASETGLFAPDLPTHRFSALYLQPDPPVNATVVAAQQLAGAGSERPSDVLTLLASQLELTHDGLAFRGRPGRRTVFGCSAACRHVIGPDAASIAFAAQSDLTLHWLCVIRLTVDRDWTWDGLAGGSISIRRDGQFVGALSLPRDVGTDALIRPTRDQTDIVFIDAITPHSALGTFPAVLHPTYEVSVALDGTPLSDPPLELALDLPVTIPPTQVPRIISAGIAMAPYERSADYSSTAPRRCALWIELERPPDDPNDAYFIRVLRNAADPLLSRLGETVSAVAEPPLPVDPEWIRVIVEGQADDRAGLGAMQPLVASADSPGHYRVPLPPGMEETAAELFGFFTYELRVGHATEWSTAQGRFGVPLRATGVQHPPPPLPCAVVRDSTGITASAPFAVPVLDGRSVQAMPPHSQMWILLYAQAEQIDGADRRNVLLTRKQAFWQRETFGATTRSNAFATATFSAAEVDQALATLRFAPGAPLSVLAVELLPNGDAVADPLGIQLGTQRILRTSPLTPVPAIC